jgi:hypothetical protein
MRSPYRVHFNKSRGWGFSVVINGQRHLFQGFLTDIQAGEAKSIVLGLIQDKKPIPSAVLLRKSVPDHVDEASSTGRRVTVTTKRVQILVQDNSESMLREYLTSSSTAS